MILLSETQAKERIAVELNKLREFSHHGWCSTCHKNGIIVRTDMMKAESECSECYAKRRMSELDPIPDVKKERVDQVRQYFARKKREEV